MLDGTPKQRRQHKRPLNHNIGRRLAEIRHNRGLSLAALAASMRLYKTSIQKWEHGRAAITADRLIALAAALDCEPADLLAPLGAPIGSGGKRARPALWRGHASDDSD